MHTKVSIYKRQWLGSFGYLDFHAVGRKDVVWFTEKKDDGSTDLFSLDDFNIRNGVSFLNAYNAGKFGAKPTLGGIFIPKKR